MVRVSIFAVALIASCNTAAATATNVSITKAQDVNWGYLNPLRGDKSPGAADLWGDRSQDQATGMLVKFNKGFSSPPHIHNITYRGIVIEGQMHNDDPNAAEAWLPTGSYWTQPAGESHITAANGQENLIYLEIDAGPYLVKPVASAFNNGEHAINVHADNLVWLDQAQSELINSKQVSLTHLWQADDKDTGMMLKLAPGADVALQSDTDDLKLVVISGELNYAAQQALKPGSFISSRGAASHHLSASQQTIIYVRSHGNILVNDR